MHVYAQMCVVASKAQVENSVLFVFGFLSVPVAPPVIEMATKRVILTRDESLSLTCNTSNVNGEITLKWVTPPGSVRPFCLFIALY